MGSTSSIAPYEPAQYGSLNVNAVFSLIDNDAGWMIQDFVRDDDVSSDRQAMHEVRRLSARGKFGHIDYPVSVAPGKLVERNHLSHFRRRSPAFPIDYFGVFACIHLIVRESDFPAGPLRILFGFFDHFRMQIESVGSGDRNSAAACCCV